MSINLNNLPYVKPIVSREGLLKHMSEWDIFTRYLNCNIKLKEPMSSPFRKDTTPSFAIYRNNYGKILYNDFVLGGGDCFQFVKYLFNYTSWYEVYSRIAIDFFIDHNFHCSDKVDNKFTGKKPELNKQPPKQKELKLAVSVRGWEDYDREYWTKYSIGLTTLRRYNVHPIDYIIFRTDEEKEKIIKSDKHAYCYIEKKDGVTSHKIYQPFSSYKWFGDVNTSIWQGWEQLPTYNDILILTKSLKDIMCISDTCRLPAVSLQSEKIKPKKSIINSLKKRFTNIFVLYDNDYDKSSNYGQIFSSELCEEFDLINLKIPSKWKAKDYSDLVKKEGSYLARKILENLISESKIEKYNDVPF